VARNEGAKSDGSVCSLRLLFHCPRLVARETTSVAT